MNFRPEEANHNDGWPLHKTTHRFLVLFALLFYGQPMRIEPALRLAGYSSVEIATCPSCNEALPRRWHKAIWIEIPLDDAWFAAYRLVIKNDQAVIAEARLFPRETAPRRERHRAPGHWSERGALVPPTGMPGTILKRLRLQDPIKVLPEAIQNWEARHGRPVVNRVLRRFAMSTKTELPRKTRGQPVRTDELVAEFARAYVEKIDQGRAAPIKELAEEHNFSRDNVRDIIREARTRGFLTRPTERGKAGGKLTPKARRVLGGARISKRKSRPRKH